MGNFGGHAIPGIAFILVSFWHVIQIYIRYYRCRKENSRFVASTWFPCDCCCGRLKNWPIEPILKIVLLSIAIFLEFYTGSPNGVFANIANEQHITMYSFFTLVSLVEILMIFNVEFPPKLNYLLFIVSFCIQFMLFRFHLHGRSSLDVLVHTLLLYILAATVIVAILEMTYQNNLLISLTLRFLVLLQGTWFLQIGFVLYKPFTEPWDQENHEQMMLVTCYFGWHVGFNILLLICLAPILSCYVNRGCKENDYDSHSMRRLIDTDSNGQVVVNLNDDSEEDEQFLKPY